MHNPSNSFIDHNGNTIPLSEAESLGFSIWPDRISIDDEIGDESNPADNYVWQYDRINGSLPQNKKDWHNSMKTHRIRPKTVRVTPSV